MERKTFATTVDVDLQEKFKNTCKEKNIKINEALEALMKAFVDSDVDIQVQTSYKVTPKK